MTCLGQETPPPLVALAFEGTLENKGTLGGQAEFVDYVPGEGALYDPGPFGECLDLTGAKRFGGRLEEMTPTGGAVVFSGRELAGIETFTLMLWARQNPLFEGINARLAFAQYGWDWLPGPSGTVISLGSGEAKVSHSLRVAFMDRGEVPPADAWRFYAVVVDRDKVRGYVGGLTGPLFRTEEVERTGPRVADWGELLIGTWGGVRPFNGWLARFRAFPTALSPESVEAVFKEDRAVRAPSTTVFDMGRPPLPARRFTLKRSAIPFSTRWQKPQALDIMRSFHATHCLWVYGLKADFVRSVQEMGLVYQGALNGLQGTNKALPGASNAGDPSGRHEDLDGNKNMPSWMVTFKPPHYTGCCNSPAFREIFFNAARQHVDIGVDMLHVDDSAMNASWVRHAGVCFCGDCRLGFREWLRARYTPEQLGKLGVADIEKFDYREHLKANGIPDAATYRKGFKSLPLTPDFTAFQVESSRRFFKDFRAKLDAWSPAKYIPISVNEPLQRPVADGSLCHTDLADFTCSEMYDRTLGTHLAAAKVGESLSLPQVASPIPKGVADARRTIAVMYALGQLHLVPWDLYMGSDATGIRPRYFGVREEYGDLYDLIRLRPELFDDYESFAEVGLVYNADTESAPALCRQMEALARLQTPFHVLPASTRDVRIPLREADLRVLRAVVLISPIESFCDEDRATLQKALSARRLRLVSPESLAPLRAHEFDLFSLEGPEKVYAFPRVAKNKSSIAIHLVNWNETQAGAREDTFNFVTLTLRHLRRWGPLRDAAYFEPGKDPVAIQPEPHEGFVRLTVPRLGTWGILVLRR